MITAAGNVRTGFTLEIKRAWDSSREGNKPDGRVPLGWLGEQYFVQVGSGDGDGDGQGVGGSRDDEEGPLCQFERALFRVPAPEKTLRSVEEVNMGNKVSNSAMMMGLVEGGADHLSLTG